MQRAGEGGAERERDPGRRERGEDVNEPGCRAADRGADPRADERERDSPAGDVSSVERDDRRRLGSRVKNAIAPAPARRVSAPCSGHARGVEARHRFQERDRARDQGQRQRRAASLTEAEIQIDQRIEPKRLEDEPVSRLG